MAASPSFSTLMHIDSSSGRRGNIIRPAASGIRRATVASRKTESTRASRFPETFPTTRHSRYDRHDRKHTIDTNGMTGTSILRVDAEASNVTVARIKSPDALCREVPADGKVVRGDIPNEFGQDFGLSRAFPSARRVAGNPQIRANVELARIRRGDPSRMPCYLDSKPESIRGSLAIAVIILSDFQVNRA